MVALQRIVVNVRQTPSNIAAKGKQGIDNNTLRVKGRWIGELANHRRTLTDSLRDLASEPLQSLMTVLVIAIALALPGALYLAVENLERLGGDVEASTQITVFVDLEATQYAISELENKLQMLAGVRRISFISREESLEEFQELSGFGSALEAMEDSPLPPVFSVQPDSVEFERAGEIAAQIEKFKDVDLVKVDMQWLERLRSMLEIGQKLITALGVTLGLGVLLAVASTIRLAIQSRTDEIIVIRLVGGTDSYIRRPFLYTGLIIGFTGALIAVLFLYASVTWLNVSIEELASLYESRFSLQNLSFRGLLGVIGIGSALGLLGAWFAVEKHLQSVEP